MRPQFKSVATVSALVFFALALTLVFAPNRIVGDWGLDVTLSVEVVCRRAGALFAGVAVMLFSARNAEPSVARSALVNGIMAVCVLLTGLGLYELNAGNVTARILIPVFIEVAMLLAFALAAPSQTARPQSRRR
jgi:hypothetical protein